MLSFISSFARRAVSRLNNKQIHLLRVQIYNKKAVTQNVTALGVVWIAIEKYLAGPRSGTGISGF